MASQSNTHTHALAWEANMPLTLLCHLRLSDIPKLHPRDLQQFVCSDARARWLELVQKWYAAPKESWRSVCVNKPLVWGRTNVLLISSFLCRLCFASCDRANVHPRLTNSVACPACVCFCMLLPFANTPSTVPDCLVCMITSKLP